MNYKYLNTMNKLATFFLTLLGLNVNSACSQQPYTDADVKAFESFLNTNGVQLVDVRTAAEFAEGHLIGAINVDFKQSDFLVQAKSQLDGARPVAVYCRSGRRSATAASQLAAEGYAVTNLLGGILAWESAQKPVTTSNVEVDVFQTKTGKSVRFQALMHASIRITYDGLEFQIDPVRQLGERTTDYASMPKADYILVTHEHRDHFDKAALEQLTAADTRLITNARCAEMAGRGEVMANGDSLQLAEGITLEAVPAYNNTEGHTQFHPRGRDNGYVLTLDGLRIYIAGDTEDIPEMAELHDIDIAFLPCNQPYTMTTEQLQRAARVIKPRVLFPYHYSQTDVSKLPSQLQAEGIDARIRHYE